MRIWRQIAWVLGASSVALSALASEPDTPSHARTLTPAQETEVGNYVETLLERLTRHVDNEAEGRLGSLPTTLGQSNGTSSIFHTNRERREEIALSGQPHAVQIDYSATYHPERRLKPDRRTMRRPGHDRRKPPLADVTRISPITPDIIYVGVFRTPALLKFGERHFTRTRVARFMIHRLGGHLTEAR